LGAHEEIGDVGEAGGAPGRNALGGECVEEIAEDVVDVDLGDEVASGTGKFGGEIVLAWLGLGGDDAGVREAESVVLGVGGEAAHATIGKFKLAKVEDISWSRVRHGEIIAHYIPLCQYTNTYWYEDFGASFRKTVEKWGKKVRSRQFAVGSSRAESGEAVRM